MPSPEPTYFNISLKHLAQHDTSTELEIDQHEMVPVMDFKLNKHQHNSSSAPMRTGPKIIVGFVWCLIAFQGLSFLYLFASLLYKHNPTTFYLQIPLFIVVVTVLCVSYYKATTSEPGSPNYLTNINYGQEIEQLKLHAHKEAEQKKQRRKHKIKGQVDLKQIESLNKPSYCFKCDVVKQRRVHHCSICRKCILRMDHHCPWVGNCVGKHNHKYFILFLFYATTGLLMVAVTITIDYLTGSYYADLLPDQSQLIWLYIVCISSYMLALSIGFLFVTQMMTACNNITTLQSFTQGIKDRNPWTTHSTLENLREIFGDGVWYLPTNPFPVGPQKISSSMQQVVEL